MRGPGWTSATPATAQSTHADKRRLILGRDPLKTCASGGGLGRFGDGCRRPPSLVARSGILLSCVARVRVFGELPWWFWAALEMKEL